jgi:hypothetical protein
MNHTYESGCLERSLKNVMLCTLVLLNWKTPNLNVTFEILNTNWQSFHVTFYSSFSTILSLIRIIKLIFNEIFYLKT